MMTESSANPAATYLGWARWLRYISPVLILLALPAAFFAYRAWPAQQQAGPPEAQLASAKTVEERLGMRITLIGVTAGGGIVDFRFRVVDANKAREMLQNPSNLPILSVEGRDTKLTLPDGSALPEEFETGATYYILYNNAQALVRPGTAVSVVIGDLRLEPIIAQ